MASGTTPPAIGSWSTCAQSLIGATVTTHAPIRHNVVPSLIPPVRCAWTPMPILMARLTIWTPVRLMLPRLLMSLMHKQRNTDLIGLECAATPWRGRTFHLQLRGGVRNAGWAISKRTASDWTLACSLYGACT